MPSQAPTRRHANPTLAGGSDDEAADTNPVPGKSASLSGGPTFREYSMPRNRSCGSYGPGHLMHWIQAKKSHEDGQPIHKVRIVAVHDDGQVEIEGHDLKLTLWYHDPDHLRSALRFDSYAAWKPKYHVLDVSSSGSSNLAALDRVEPCVPPIRRRPTETTRQFIERAMGRTRVHSSRALARRPRRHTRRQHR